MKPDQSKIDERILLKIAEKAELIRSTDNEVFGLIEKFYKKDPETKKIKVREIREISSDEFRDWLINGYIKEHKQTPTNKAVNNTRDGLERKARLITQKTPVYTRIARVDDTIYVDLCDDTWKAVKISSEGWKIVARPKVYFRRFEGMEPLPRPKEIEKKKQIRSVIDLRKNFNNANANGRRLISAWLLGALNPALQHPILVLVGGADSTTSIISEMLKLLIDPSKDPLYPISSFPKNGEKLREMAKESWVLAFNDNGKISESVSGAIWRLADGSGIISHPIILTRSDLSSINQEIASRALIVNMEGDDDDVEEEEKESAAKIRNTFKEKAPLYLGALFNAVAVALKNKKKTKAGPSLFMGDFFDWVLAAESVLFKKKGQFLKAYEENRHDLNLQFLEGDPLVLMLQVMISGRRKWEGKAEDLLRVLVREAKQIQFPFEGRSDWPKTGNYLAKRLNELKPKLKSINLLYTNKHNRGGSLINLEIINDPNIKNNIPPETRK